MLRQNACFAAGERLQGPSQLAVFNSRRLLHFAKIEPVAGIEEEKNETLKQGHLQFLFALRTPVSISNQE